MERFVVVERSGKHLESRGAHFIEKRLEFDWGIIAVLLDTDGNQTELGEIW
ncbi:hypothetical protein [Lentibacillus sp. CBA3610]|uniref:hypothetical protein n=1 Tax=Lentibacillus sp. CBA3610 TaxID=2518176 RepID=UPI0015952BB3|nr:hypothetical protein [Lentibacillus sp. CBA3610]